MTSSTSPTLALRLIQRLKKKQAETSNAFTLVELLVVVAIVGILSAIALPNFLAQTDKAKATEAKTLIASALKEAMVASTESGDSGLTLWAQEQCPEQSKLFDLTCSHTGTQAVVSAAATNDANGELQDKTIEGRIALDATRSDTLGQVEICGNELSNVGIDPCGGNAGGGVVQ